ncbi:hypothetical protein EWM58_01635, partial [Candidatus Erwinia dacicola]
LKQIEILYVEPIDGYRILFDWYPDSDSTAPVNMRLFLRTKDETLSETWLYQYFPPPPDKRKYIDDRVMTVMMLSLAGIPMTVGFIGKFYVIAVGVSAHLWWLTGTVVLGSAIGLYYYLRMTVSLYLNPPELMQRDTPANWAFTAGGVVVLISAILVLALGIYPQPLISLVKLAQPLM